MQSVSQRWHQWLQKSVYLAWGLAPQDGAWILVDLIRSSASLVRVGTFLILPAPAQADTSDPGWLSSHLRLYGRSTGRARHRLNMAMPQSWLQEGLFEIPPDSPQEDWLYEVQLEVAQAFQLEPNEVSFDFEAAPLADDLVQRAHWIGCTQTQMQLVKNCARAAGWRLAAVEPPLQAAQRGVRALRGGVTSLLTQAPQDWQFHLEALSELRSPLGHLHRQGGAPAQTHIDEAISQVMLTPGGPRLVAAGLALRAWQ